MKVLVIGGARFIGKAAASLLAERHQLALFTRGGNPVPSWAKRYVGDRREGSKLEEALESFQPEIVLDMCALTTADAAQVSSYSAQFRTVLVSSADVYRNFGGALGLESGDPDAVPLTEESPLRSVRFPYRGKDRGAVFEVYDKIPIEEAVLANGGSVMRLPMVYGPGDYQHRLFGTAFRMRAGRPVIVVSREFASWVSCRGWIGTVASTLCAAVERPVPGVFNVADRDTHTELEWMRLIAQATDWDGEFRLVDNQALPEELQPGLDERFHITMASEKARSEWSIDEGPPRLETIRQTVEWELSHPPSDVPDDLSAEDRFLAGR